MNESWQDKLRAMLDAQGGYSPEPETETPVHQQPEAPRQKSPLSILFERKGRAGKQATIVSGFELDDRALADVAATLKKSLGTGGSARGGEILIQGDRRDDVRKALLRMGLKVK